MSRKLKLGSNLKIPLDAILFLLAILYILLVTTGCSSTKEVNLYFRESNSDFLAIEKREVPTNDFELHAIKELIKGPLDNNLDNPIPKGTKLLNFEIKGKVAVIDLSSEIMSSNIGSSGEGLIIYSIANTMGNLPTIERTKLLVEGKEVDTLYGHYDTLSEIEPNDELIRRD